MFISSDVGPGSRARPKAKSHSARALTRRNRNLRAVFPEVAAGGYSRIDGAVEFYSRISALLHPHMHVVEIGAGRGGWMTKPQAPFVRSLRRIQGRVAKLSGVDIDPAVLQHRGLDEAHVVPVEESMPFADESIDLVYADWVLEHVETPGHFAGEVGRIIKPGGWFCARTPNRFGLTGLAVNAIPNSLHEPILRHLSPWRQARDIFPTHYQLNTKGRIARHFPPGEWESFSYFRNSDPCYVQRWAWAIQAARLYMKVVPTIMATDFLVLLRKR